MFNPKRYFEELISTQLQQFVHALDESQLSVSYICCYFMKFYIMFFNFTYFFI